MDNVKKHLNILGMRVEDRVTGFSGVAASVCFDLYGCVQVTINPGMDKDGKLKEQCWFDIARLKLKSKEPVMAPPNFETGPEAQALKGAAEKQRFNKF